MKKVIPKMMFGVYIIGIILLLSACNSQLDIQQQYPFTLSAMPVQKSIVIDETAEIRMKIIREGHFEETEYYIRYYQPDGTGDLKLEDGTVFLPNDLYKLTEVYSGSTTLPNPLTSKKSIFMWKITLARLSK